MMQPAYALMGDDATGGHRATSALGCSLPQPQMRAIFMIVANIFREQTFEMPFIECNHVIQ